MIVRGRYWGFYLSGPDRGMVQEASSAVLVRPNVTPVAVYVNYDSAPAASSVGFSATQWHHHELRIGNRMYGVWSISAYPNPDDSTEAMLCLIDMDPIQAQLCESRPRLV